MTATEVQRSRPLRAAPAEPRFPSRIPGLDGLREGNRGSAGAARNGRGRCTSVAVIPTSSVSPGPDGHGL